MNTFFKVMLSVQFLYLKKKNVTMLSYSSKAKRLVILKKYSIYRERSWISLPYPYSLLCEIMTMSC